MKHSISSILQFKVALGVVALFVAGVCLGADTVFASKFDRLVPVKISAKEKTKLENRRINVAEVEKMSQPEKWNIHWGNFPADCRFYGRDSHWGVHANSELRLLSNACFGRLSRNYQLKFVAAMPADAQGSRSRVSVEVHGYGMMSSGRMFYRDAIVKRGESVSLEMPFQFANGVPNFRVLLKIQGDVILQELTVTELPDDLAQSGITVLEGTLTELSALPDPKKSDYPDCRFTALLEGDNIIAGVSCPQKLQLVIDGFQKYQLLATKNLKPGKIRCFAIPFEKLPEEKKSVQQADDLNLFELPSYYALEIETVHKFSQNSVIPFSDKQEYISVFERQINPPLSAEAVRLQKQAIADSLTRVTQMLEPYSASPELDRLNARFADAWETEKAKDAPGFNRVAGTYVWRNIDNSFWALPEKYTLIPEYHSIGKEKLDALLALQDFLNANGCQLLIGIVPGFYDISARVINREFREIPDFNTAQLVRDLLRHNLEAVYVSDKLLENYHRYPFAFFYPNDWHPADTAQDILTDVFADLLKRYNLPETLDPAKFSLESTVGIGTNNRKFFFPTGCDIGANQPGKPYLCRRVWYDGKDLPRSPQSPVLVLGNSFIGTPMNFPESFPCLLAMKLHTDIAVMRVNNSGPMTTCINSFLASPEKYLAGKRVVILVMGFRHFYNIHHFNNIRVMDRQMSLLSGKTIERIIPVAGNCAPPENFRYLAQVKCVTLPASGKHVVIDQVRPESGGAEVLVVPVCADVKSGISRLRVNGTAYAIPESLGMYRWNKVVTSIPADAKQLTIELEGEPGTTVALGDIQIFK